MFFLNFHCFPNFLKIVISTHSLLYLVFRGSELEFSKENNSNEQTNSPDNTIGNGQKRVLPSKSPRSWEDEILVPSKSGNIIICLRMYKRKKIKVENYYWLSLKCNPQLAYQFLLFPKVFWNSAILQFSSKWRNVLFGKLSY